MSRHAVVVCEARALEAEAEPIAALVAMTAYDVRLRLGGMLPAILCWTSDLAEATRLQRALADRGHGALVVDPQTVTPSERALRVRRFAFEADRFKANDRDPGIAYADITALVRAATTTAVLRKVSEREPIYEVGRTRNVTEEREHVRHESTASNLLYICAAEGPPRLLVSGEAKYLSLGPKMRPTEHDNFFATIELLRARAPGAVYDERFAERAHDSHKLAVARGNDPVAARSDSELDLLVHALARWLTRGSGSPYRNTSDTRTR